MDGTKHGVVQPSEGIGESAVPRPLNTEIKRATPREMKIDEGIWG